MADPGERYFSRGIWTGENVMTFRNHLSPLGRVGVFILVLLGTGALGGVTFVAHDDLKWWECIWLVAGFLVLLLMVVWLLSIDKLQIIRDRRRYKRTKGLFPRPRIFEGTFDDISHVLAALRTEEIDLRSEKLKRPVAHVSLVWQETSGREPFEIGKRPNEKDSLTGTTDYHQFVSDFARQLGNQLSIPIIDKIGDGTGVKIGGLTHVAGDPNLGDSQSRLENLRELLTPPAPSKLQCEINEGGIAISLPDEGTGRIWHIFAMTGAWVGALALPAIAIYLGWFHVCPMITVVALSSALGAGGREAYRSLALASGFRLRISNGRLTGGEPRFGKISQPVDLNVTHIRRIYVDGRHVVIQPSSDDPTPLVASLNTLEYQSNAKKARGVRIGATLSEKEREWLSAALQLGISADITGGRKKGL